MIKNKSLRNLLILLAISVFLIIPMLRAETALANSEAEQFVFALANEQKVEKFGETVTLQAYNIEGYNYFKLRDIALLLNNTDACFSVKWDEDSQRIELIPDKPYISLGNEMELGSIGDLYALSNPVKLSIAKWDGTFRDYNFVTYNIGGNNYFKLRDIASALFITVDWDENSRSIIISTTEYYCYGKAVRTALNNNNDDIVLKINGDPVSQSQLELDLVQTTFSNSMSTSDAIEITIMGYRYLQEYEKKGLTVSEDELQKGIEEQIIKTHLIIDGDDKELGTQIWEYFRGLGMSPEDYCNLNVYKEGYKAALLIQKVQAMYIEKYGDEAQQKLDEIDEKIWDGAEIKYLDNDYLDSLPQDDFYENWVVDNNLLQ